MMINARAFERQFSNGHRRGDDRFAEFRRQLTDGYR
jgi:hypothetical protein